MELIIALTVNNLSLLEKKLSKTTDILVFDQKVMVKLDKKGINYKTTEDFYSAETYTHEVDIYRKKVKFFLSQLDRACENISDFPFAYTGNELYLLTLFDDLFYLENLIKRIKQNYKSFFLFAPQEPEKITISQLTISQLRSKKKNGSINFVLERTPKRIIQLLYSSIDFNFLRDEDNKLIKIPLKYEIERFKYKINERLNNNNFSFPKNFNYLNNQFKKAYIIQETNEVKYLKKNLPHFKFYNPTTKLRQKIELKKYEKLPENLIENILRNFIEENQIYLSKYIRILIISYYKEIVGRIKIFKIKFEKSVKKDKPSFMLLGIGTRDVIDTICCYIANLYNIPVFIFQHGGSRAFFYTPYQECLEYNTRVNKTLFVQAKIDENKLQNLQTKVLNMGSIEQYENNFLQKNTHPKKNILLCLGPDTNFSFRHFLNGFGAYRKHKQSIEIIEAVELSNLSVDIKLHPTGEINSFFCYKNILKNNKFNKINILYGCSAEYISKNYKVIIIDYLGSAIIKDIFCLKIPIILYEKDFDKIQIDRNILFDLSRRCYVARNKIELANYLDKFKKKELTSKWNQNIIDDYICPIGLGNPAQNIANYINNEVLKNKLFNN